LDTITKVANYVNRLPAVQWSDASTLIKSCFLTRTDGSRLHVQPFASHIAVSIPPSVHSVVIQDEEVSERTPWVADDSNPKRRELNGTDWPVTPGSVVEFRRASRVVPATAQPTGSLWAPIRRMLCETRDRVQPLLRGKTNGLPKSVDSKIP